MPSTKGDGGDFFGNLSDQFLVRERFHSAYCSPSSDLNGLYKSPKWRDGLRVWNKGQVNFDTALTDFNSRQFKTWMMKRAIKSKHLAFVQYKSTPSAYTFRVYREESNKLSKLMKKSRPNERVGIFGEGCEILE